jgi:uncharacterized protein YkwD
VLLAFLSKESMNTTLPLILLTLVLHTTLPLSQDSAICLNTEEKKLYDQIMKYRQSKRLAGIPLSAKLTQIAQTHAKDLSEHYEFGNKNCNIHSWSSAGNWSACCYTSNHANPTCMWNKPNEIAGYENPGYEIAYYHSGGAKAEGALNVWKTSPGHNTVIVNQGNWKNLKWKAIGVGIYKEYAVVWFGEIEDGIKASPCK